MAEQFLPRPQLASPIGYVKDGKVYLDRAFHTGFLLKLISLLEAKLTPEALAAALALVDAALDDVSDALVVVSDATDAANTAAGNAQDTADSIAALSSLTNSQVSQGTTITATDAGTDATASVNAHVRTYGTGATVSVNASSVTGLAFSTNYALYYDQSSRLGGAITLVATTDPIAAQPSDTFPDRHYVGSIRTPADGAADTDGVPNIAILPPEIVINGGWL